MDALDEIFNTMTVKKAVFTRMEATAPWGFKSPGGGKDIKFVLVLNGSAILTTKVQKAPMTLSGGDFYMMFDEAPFVIVDHPKSKIIDCAIIEKYRVGNHIEIGGGGSLTTFISGSFEIDPLDAKPILEVFPRFLHMKLDQRRTHSFQSVLEMLALETEKPGAGANSLISRLYEILLIHAIRIYSEQAHPTSTGWLAGLSNTQIGAAVRAMHKDISSPWTVESLASIAKMSRSAFASNFKSTIGQTPMDYLTNWRIYQASVLIRKNGYSLSEACHAVGYESESAFNKIFKRKMGMTPGEFRRDTTLSKKLI